MHGTPASASVTQPPVASRDESSVSSTHWKALNAQPRVLIVDDDDNFAEAVADTLQKAGFAVERSEDAAAALQRLREPELPDLIVLDLVMPRMDGWEFRVVQRGNPTLAAIPVIVLSADKSAKAFAIDADAHLSKPIEPSMLVATARQLIAYADKQRSEAHARELLRLSSLGAIAAGLAHEINNPLAIVLGYTEVARRAANGDDGEQRAQARKLALALVNIEEAAQRIAGVVREIANFARGERDETVSVVQVLEGSTRLLANQIRQRARLERSHRSRPTVRCNPAKLGQLFLMLLTRALRVIDDGASDRNCISTEVLVTRGTAIIRITDTGVGVPPERVRQVFDPRASNGHQGSMELSLVQELVQEMRGTIDVMSGVGVGTTFTIELPALQQDEHASQSVQPQPLASVERPRLLVIDDEPSLCTQLRDLLESYYRVETADDPTQALAQMLQGEPYDVVLCDLMMPKLSGMDLHARLCVERPEQAARMVFMTGGTFSERARMFVANVDGCLTKPFDTTSARRAIERKLQAVANGKVSS